MGNADDIYILDCVVEVRTMLDDIRVLRERLTQMEQTIKHVVDEYEGRVGYKAALHNCPFPGHCDMRDRCKKESCGYDACSYGYAYRMR